MVVRLASRDKRDNSRSFYGGPEDDAARGEKIRANATPVICARGSIAHCEQQNDWVALGGMENRTGVQQFLDRLDSAASEPGVSDSEAALPCLVLLTY